MTPRGQVGFTWRIASRTVASMARQYATGRTLRVSLVATWWSESM
jgi:hypothetical protein